MISRHQQSMMILQQGNSAGFFAELKHRDHVHHPPPSTRSSHATQEEDSDDEDEYSDVEATATDSDEEDDTSSSSDRGGASSGVAAESPRKTIDLRRTDSASLKGLRGSVIQHRNFEMATKLAIPRGHPRSSSSASIEDSEDGSMRSGRSNSIEIRRTDAPQFAVRPEPDCSTPPPRTRQLRRRMSLDPMNMVAAATSSLLR